MELKQGGGIIHYLLCLIECVYLHTYIHIYIYIYTCIFTHTHTQIYIYTHIYIYIYTYIMKYSFFEGRYTRIHFNKEIKGERAVSALKTTGGKALCLCPESEYTVFAS
jgi:hypothetical protein